MRYAALRANSVTETFRSAEYKSPARDIGGVFCFGCNCADLFSLFLTPTHRVLNRLHPAVQPVDALRQHIKDAFPSAIVVAFMGA